MATVAEEIAALRGTRRATLRDLLTDAKFSRLWRAMLVSSLGDWVGFVAVAALVARLGGGTFGGLAVAGVMVARLLPSLLFGPFAGLFVDRFDRRKVMMSADIARGALYASMPFMPKLWMIFLLSFVIECLSLLWTPAKDASLPNLVTRRQLPNANSVGLVITYGTLPLGATIFTALAGLAEGIGAHVRYFGVHPESLALWLDALTFLFSARMIWGLAMRSPAAARAANAHSERLNLTSAVKEISDGVRFLRGHKLIGSMTIGIVVAFAGAGSVISLGPVFARYSLHAQSTGFGILMIALGIGMGAGMASMRLLTKLIEEEKLFYVALLLTPFCLFGLAAMPKLWLASVWTVPMGFGAGLAWVTGYTVLQENVTDEFRGRTFATLTVMGRLALFLALAGFPAIATAIGRVFVHGAANPLDFGTRVALWLGGGVVIAGTIRAGRGLKRYRLAKPVPLSLVPRLLGGERPGLFVVFEGVEGAGKGTQVELAREYLEAKGRDVVMTREPGGTILGERLREALLDPATGSLEPRAEALLFAASRAQHVMTVIRPALEKGKVVLCDRFIDSSVAYQGAARGLGEQDVLTLNAWATQGLFPDLVLLLNVDPDVGLTRAGSELDRIESEERTFHARVADAFLRIADEHPDRYVVIDASRSPEEVHGEVRGALDRVLRTSSPPPRPHA